MKVVSIQTEGVINHINRYFKQRDSQLRYSDVIRLKELCIGGRHISVAQQAQELKVSRPTLYLWHKHIDASL